MIFIANAQKLLTQELTELSERPCIALQRSKLELVIPILKDKLTLLLADAVWDEPEIEQTAKIISSFEWFANDKSSYELANYLYRSYLDIKYGFCSEDKLLWTDEQIEIGLPFMVDSWELKHFKHISGWGGLASPLPKTWRYVSKRVFGDSPLVGQELIEALDWHQDDEEPPYLRSVGPSKALDTKRELVTDLMFNTGYITNQIIARRDDSEFLLCFKSFKAAIKEALSTNS